MPGNDIIDISHTRQSTNWRRKGFLQKVFSPEEQQVISDSSDPFIAIWRMWSMKESAYKLFIQQGHERFFNPAKILCTITSEHKGEVRIYDLEMQTHTEMSPAYIFTTAILEPSDHLENGIFPLSPEVSQGASTHQKILEYIAAKHRLGIDQLQLKKTSQNIPQIFYQEQKLPIAVSLTHHGNFGAFSILTQKQWSTTL